MFVRRGLPLRWRIAVLTSLTIAALSVAASVIAYLVVSSSLYGEQQVRLRIDAQLLAEAYSNVTPVDSFVSAGFVQLYDQAGNLFVGRAPFDDLLNARIPITPTEFERNTIKIWQGELANRQVQAAISPFSSGGISGYVAVVAETQFITEALRRLARSLVITTVLLVAVSTLAGYLVALFSMRPLTYLARLAAQLGPEKLEPIGYEGPSDEVAQLAHVLNDLVARLKVSADAQRSFLAETSHELRTPLTSLQGFLDRAARQAYPGVRRDLDDAKRISVTMSRLVADLLQLSRGELVREIVPHLLDPFDDVLRPVAEEYPGVNLVGKPGDTLVGDPERLRQLIRNLTANAVRACTDHSMVTLVSRREAAGLILEVSDTGPGIPQEILPKIFDKFYKGPGGGAGLGLAIAQQIATAHGATLEVSSRLGKGTTFRLILPDFDTEEEFS